MTSVPGKTWWKQAPWINLITTGIVLAAGVTSVIVTSTLLHKEDAGGTRTAIIITLPVVTAIVAPVLVKWRRIRKTGTF